MEFTELTIFVRQIANGSMAIGALFVLAVFGRFLWKEWSRRTYSVTAVKAALAIFILTLGHFIRSASGWLEFMLQDAGWDIGLWLWASWSWFTIAAILVLIGKALMLLNFSPWAHRKKITVIAITSAILIPTAIALLV